MTDPIGDARDAIANTTARSIPVIAVAAAAPSFASSGGVIIVPGTSPGILGTCNAAGDFVFSVSNNGAAAPGQSVSVSLPSGFSWPDTSTGAKTFVTDANGQITLSGVNVGTRPGNFLVTALLLSTGVTTTVTVTVTGTWIGQRQGYGGTGVFPIYYDPADTNNLGTPDNWAYCLDHDTSARTRTVGFITGAANYIAAPGNYYGGDATVQAKIRWILAHSFPKLTLAQFAAAVGLSSIARNDAAEATQYAIWRFSNMNYDSSWQWENSDSEAAYWYLVNGANAAGGQAGTESIVLVPSSNCGTPTAADHAQTLILVEPYTTV